MDDDRWRQLVNAIEGDDIELMIEACKQLQDESEVTDIPRLLELLQHESFVVREAAAWPLAVLGTADELPSLFDAYQRGFDEGLDNDGLTTALIELASLHSGQTRTHLEELRNSPIPSHRKHAKWLLQSC